MFLSMCKQDLYACLCGCDTVNAEVFSLQGTHFFPLFHTERVLSELLIHTLLTSNYQDSTIGMYAGRNVLCVVNFMFKVLPTIPHLLTMHFILLSLLNADKSPQGTVRILVEYILKEEHKCCYISSYNITIT